MKWYTHAVIGANAAWVAYPLGVVDDRAGLLLVAGGLAALLPDIDATSAKIHYIAGGLLQPFRGNHTGVFQHRGIWHSLFAVACVGVVSWVFLADVHTALPMVLTVGYASHPLIDAWNTSVGFLFPFYRKRIQIVPRFLRSNVGGLGDILFFLLGLTFVIIFSLSALSVIGKVGAPAPDTGLMLAE